MTQSEAPTPTVSVRAGGGTADYDVLVERGLLRLLPELLRSRVGAHRYAILADETVAALYGGTLLRRMEEAGLGADMHTFPPGEGSKSRRGWSELTDALLRAGHGRDSAVVALGGGVTGDLAGFVAATFMRGIPVVQVPTSLVAMVDASVGGKTGLDVPAGKNLVGAFHPPLLVVVDPDVVESLPRAERAQGLAEAVKHGAIVDRAYLERLEVRAGSLLDGTSEVVEEEVRRSVEIKADVVSRDEREGGLRQILNFGHTLGHALEAEASYRLGHGSAVALGMLLEARLGERLGVTEKGTGDVLSRVLDSLELPRGPEGLPEVFQGGLDPERVLRWTREDKKGRRGRCRYVLLARPGAVARSGDGWTHDVPEEAVRNLLSEWLEGG